MTNIEDKNRVCPVELAGSLDSRVRRWLQNPAKILAPYVSPGMTVLDIGCGPGFFSVELAQMVGAGGRVIAADVQEGMLEKLRSKIQGTALEPRISLVKAGKDSLNVSGTIDFGLAFFVVHEIPGKEALFRQVRSLLKHGGQFLVVEPRLFHVSEPEFEASMQIAQQCGFTRAQGPRLPFCWSSVLR